MNILISVLCLIMAYLYGSVPFALVIGKVFYNTDVRTKGSGNLGGTNAGRGLGKKAGAAVILLDGTKCIVAILITRLLAAHFNLSDDLFYFSALACIIGHCYPIFAGFKGGKGVSSAIAYTLMTNIYAFIFAVCVFMFTLKTTKYVSLSSIIGSVSVAIIAPFIGLIPPHWHYSTVGIITNFVIAALIVYKHHANISRIKNGTESKVQWL